MRKICVITGTRAEYGLLRWGMQGIKTIIVDSHSRPLPAPADSRDITVSPELIPDGIETRTAVEWLLG